jgi:CubicO group peptidase (beta-lactamase class C family)
MTDDTFLRGRLLSVVARRPPGIAVAIVTPDGPPVTLAAGLADLTHGLAASPQMVCPWFSMTKIMTATAAVRLAERGMLDLDEPIARYVPQFGRLRPRRYAERITARHLLTHSAGLANPTPIRWIHPADARPVDQGTLLDKVLATRARLRFEPGSRSRYSNLGPLGLGVAMASLTGATFPEIVVREVLGPLGMHDTGFGFTAEMRARAATGYHGRWSPMRFALPRWVVGEPAGRWISLKRFLVDGQAYGGLVGSLDDVVRFLRMHVQDGELDGARVLTAQAARQMREVVVRGQRRDLGLGWFRPASRRNAEPSFVEHLGGGAGFFNLIRVYPQRQVGIAVMGNATSYDINAVAQLAFGAGS